MKYIDYDMDGYKLHIIKTDRFKTVFYNVSIRFEDERDNEKYIGLLSRLLLQTSSKYDSLRDINLACASIYDPFYNIKVLSSGACNVLNLSASFVNEKYTEKGMNEANFKFLTDFLLKPKVVDGGFDSEVFKIQKEKLLEFYNSYKDRPREYASGRLSEEMKTRKYSIMKLDELKESIKMLTPLQLYQFYQKIMENGQMDVFVSGDIDPLEVKKIIGKIIKFKGENKKITHQIVQEDYNKKINLITEDAQNTQSNLIVGCKLLNLSDFERNYVFVLYSWILGGGMNSLLNQSVREKNSLCYYIYASRDTLLDTMKIYAGINAADFDKTYQLILSEMKNMEEGNFSLELFEGVKQIYYNSLIKIDDMQEDLVSSYISEVFLGNDNINVRKEKMEKVTKEDIMNLAKKMHIDTVYLLKGVR